MLIDSHCHLNLLSEKFNLEEIILRAKENDIKYMQTICTSLEEFSEVLAIAEKFENVFSSVGVHPNEVKTNITAANLIKLSQHPKVIGLGETGLDYYHESTNREEQIKSFNQHIIAAQKTRLPLIVHSREAEQDTIEIITSNMKNAFFPGLIHCFTASKDFASKMLDLGFYISISGIVTFKNAENLKEIVKFLPLDRLLIETDAPYLAPIPVRGMFNEPSYVKYVAEYIAILKDIEYDHLAHTTTENFFQLFTKAKKYLGN